MKIWQQRGALIAVLVLFIATAMPFVIRPGIEADEALVGNGLYGKGLSLYGWHIGSSEIPVMIISYLGALKTWLYAFVFLIAKPSAISLRIPTVLMGAATVWVFFSLLERTVGPRAAWIGAILLATDTSFLILEAIDYGPNALHFLLKLGALILLVRFDREPSLKRARFLLACAFFLFGLGLWDKAIFAWSLFGLLVAVVCVFPRAFFRHFTIRNFGVAAAALIIGALPLIIYNFDHPLETLRANVRMTNDPFMQKAVVLRQTVDGASPLGFIIEAAPGPLPANPPKFFLEIGNVTQYPFHNFTLYGIATAVLLLLLPGGSRQPTFFALTVCVGTWLPMVLAGGAGIGAHHSILLWPFHLMAIATSLTRVTFRWIAPLGAIVLASASLALTNHYYILLIHNGPAIRWTDAMNPLVECLQNLKERHIYFADWGILQPVNLLTQGKIETLYPDLATPAGIRYTVLDPQAVFVVHTPATAFGRDRATIDEGAAREGLQEERIETIYDRSGRAIFEVFRLRKIHM